MDKLNSFYSQAKLQAEQFKSFVSEQAKRLSSLNPITEKKETEAVKDILPVSVSQPKTSISLAGTLPLPNEEDDLNEYDSLSAKDLQIEDKGKNISDEHGLKREFVNNPDEGKHIEEEYGDNGKYGTASIDRMDTLSQNLQIQSNKIAYLEKFLHEKGFDEFKPSDDDLKGLKENTTTFNDLLDYYITSISKSSADREVQKACTQLRHAWTMLNNVTEHVSTDDQPTFLSSISVRNKMEKDNNSKDFNSNTAPKIPSVPTNMRVQRFKGPEESDTPLGTSFVRMGVHYDPRDPGNSIPDLRFYQKNRKALETELLRRINLYQKYIDAGDLKKAAAVRQSMEPLSHIKAGERMINDHIAKKQLYLDDLMLHYVATQIDTESEKIDSVLDGATLNVVHLGLLNEEKSKIENPSGLIHDEAILMKEMAANFATFDGREIILDGKGPYIDIEGKIHTSKEALNDDGKPKTLKLKPQFVNITVQGYTENGPVQRELNQKSLNALDEQVKDLKANEDPQKADEIKKIKSSLASIQKKLDKGQSNYQIACDLFAVMLDIKKVQQNDDKQIFSCSVGCYSAKDRTGVVAEASVIMTRLKDSVQLMEKDPKKQRSLLQKFGRGMLSKHSMAHKAAADSANSSEVPLKVSSINIPTVTDHIQGVWKRIMYGARQLTALSKD